MKHEEHSGGTEASAKPSPTALACDKECACRKALEEIVLRSDTHPWWIKIARAALALPCAVQRQTAEADRWRVPVELRPTTRVVRGKWPSARLPEYFGKQGASLALRMRRSRGDQ